MVIALALEKICTDGGTQSRAELNQSAVDEYAQTIREGTDFPPVVVFYDGKKYWLADGFHRLAAYRSAGALEVNAEVHQGEKRDAILYSVGANADHGLRRTNDDKRRAVMTLLHDREWSKWSDREIARRCAVSQPFVSGLRPSATSDTDNDYQYDPLKPRAYTHPKTGATTEMRTGNIGKKKAEKLTAKERREAQKAENEQRRQEHLAKLNPETRKSIEDRQAAIAARKNKPAEGLSAEDRIAELEQAVAELERESAALKAENKTYAEMRAQFEQGGFEKVIAGKDEIIQTLETRLYRESEDKASWMKSAKYWQAEAKKLGWSRDAEIDIETGEVVNG